MPSNVTNKDLPVNHEPLITIKRGKHNKENPYVMILKSMAQDFSLPLEAKGLLTYLLSLPDNWIVHARHLAHQLKIGKNKIYTLLNKLIELGYAAKEETRAEKGLFSSVIYYFFEEKVEIQEQSTVSQNGETDHQPCPRNRDTDNRDPDFGTLKNNIPLENTDEKDIKPPNPQKGESASASGCADSSSSFEKPKKTKASKEFSSEVKQVTEQIIAALERSNPDYRPPDNPDSMQKHIDLLLNKDKHSAERILEVLEFALTDTEKRGDFDGWSPIMFTKKNMEIFRRNFVSIAQRIKSKPKRNFAPSSNDDAGYARLMEMEKNAL